MWIYEGVDKIYAFFCITYVYDKTGFEHEWYRDH